MTDYTLSHGSHPTREQGMCAMEWVAYIANEPHSDKPKCVDVALRRFGIGINDHLPDDLRQQLRPYLARMIGTAGDGRTQERLYMMADWAVRVAAPERLEAAGYKEHADKLRAVEPVVDKATAKRAKKVARDAADAAYAADAAAAAADAAAYAAAAAAAAAADAAYAAARAMWAKLLPSVLELLDRMLPTETVDLPEPMACEYEALLTA